MLIDVALLPQHLTVETLIGRTAVVFDVLRATTSMAAALSAGVEEIRIFPTIASASLACKEHRGTALLCGEINALPPAGFDLGNSPGQFTLAHAGRTVFISTTNGTGAILACSAAEEIFIGALVNAAAVAQAAMDTGSPITLVCAGTNGQVAMEDVLGCGAVIEALRDLGPVALESDRALIAQQLFMSSRKDLTSKLRATRGGQNVIAAGLPADIDFAARLNSIPIVGRVSGNPPVVRRVERA